MKKTLCVLAIATASLATAPAVFAQDQAPVPNAKQGWYIDGDLGVSRIDKSSYDHNNYAGGVTGGYRWAVSPEMSVGAEVGYVYLGKQRARDGANAAYWANGGTNSSRSSLRGPTLGGALRWNLIQNWYINLRGGLFDGRGGGLSDSAYAPVYRRFNTNLGYYAGVGTGWDITQHWGVGLNWNYYQVKRNDKEVNGQVEGTRVHMDTQTVTAAVEYRF